MKLSLEVVSGERSNGRLFIYGSHIYSSSRKFQGVVYLKCIFEGCNGTGVYCEGDDFLRVLRGHSHEPDRDEEDRLLFRQALRTDAYSTTLDFQAIYNEHAPRLVP